MVNTVMPFSRFMLHTSLGSQIDLFNLSHFPAMGDKCCLLSHLLMHYSSIYCKQYGP